VTRLFVGRSLAGVLLSLACAALAMALLLRMTRTRGDAQTAAWPVAFLSLWPATLFLGAAHAESLLLLFVLTALMLAERGMWVAACAAGALAALTRNVGVLVALPLLLVCAERNGWLWRRGRPEWPRDVRLAWLALQWMNSVVLLPFAASVGAVLVLACAWRCLPTACSVWVLAIVLVPLLTPAPHQVLLSYPRFLLLAFPLFIGVALLTGRWRLVWRALPVGSAILLAWLSASLAL
jgi:hypothetical protein